MKHFSFECHGMAGHCRPYRTPWPLVCLVAAAACGCADADRPVGWPAGALETATGAKPSYFDTPRPWIIGHRGTGEDRDSEPRAENTIPALTHAILEEGAVGVEFDVTLTKDLELVIMHDPMLERTTDCTGCIWNRTLEAVQQCTATSGDISGIHPPSFDEVLGELASLPVWPLIMIDTKVFGDDSCAPPFQGDQMDAELGRRIGEHVQAAGVARWAAVQGHAPLLIAARMAAPEIVTLLIHDDMQQAVDDARRAGFRGVAVGLDRLHDQPVTTAQQNGLLIDTFVVNAPSDLSVAVLYDADILETDRVEALLDAFRD
jgi:glycerophosphoryl diester phosphodiesterase